MKNRILPDPEGPRAAHSAPSRFKTYFRCPKCGFVKYAAGSRLGEKLPCEKPGCTGIMTGAQDPLGR